MTSRPFIALLRGINVGGRNKLPMAELRALAEGLGWTDVRTYIQSGNVVFRAEAMTTALDARPATDVRPASAAEAEQGAYSRLESELEDAIQERFGFSVPALVRSAAAQFRFTPVGLVSGGQPVQAAGWPEHGLGVGDRVTVVLHFADLDRLLRREAQPTSAPPAGLTPS